MFISQLKLKWSWPNYFTKFKLDCFETEESMHKNEIGQYLVYTAKLSIYICIFPIALMG